MSQVISVVLRNASTTLLIAAAVAATSGCAHQQQQAVAAHQKEIQALQARLDEAERTNGRLVVRIEELEDDVFLLQDRVDANRIALQRKGIMGQRAHARDQRGPGPAAETHWGDTTYGHEQPRARSQHRVTRIPLGGGDTGPDQRTSQPREESYGEQVPTSQVPTASAPNVRGPSTTSAEDAELVITESEFAEFEARYGGAPDRAPKRSSRGTKQPQPDVTEERLPTTDELKGGEEKIVEAAPNKSKDSLAIYKDSLASYRGGHYREALSGFESFLAGGPRADYVDNALYWIGECHFGLGEYDTAVKFFQRVLSEQPDGNKVPDAMLKMSLAYDRVGRGKEATRLLEDVNRQYPATNAGRLASQKLEERR